MTVINCQNSKVPVGNLSIYAGFETTRTLIEFSLSLSTSDSLQSFSQVYDLVSHTTYVVCVHFINGWQNLQFKVDSEPQSFEKLFMAILFTLMVFSFLQRRCHPFDLYRALHHWKVQII